MSETKGKYVLESHVCEVCGRNSGSPPGEAKKEALPFSDMVSTSGPQYAQEWNGEPTELDNDLEERLLSVRNNIDLALLAFHTERHELISTCIEDALYKIQWLVDDYCVDGVRDDN